MICTIIYLGNSVERQRIGTDSAARFKPGAGGIPTRPNEKFVNKISTSIAVEDTTLHEVIE